MPLNCPSTFYSHEKGLKLLTFNCYNESKNFKRKSIKGWIKLLLHEQYTYCHYDFSNRNLQRFERTIDGQESRLFYVDLAKIRFLNTLRDIVLVLHHQPRCCQVPDRGQAHGVPRPGPGQAPHLRIELATEFRDSFHNIRMRPRCNFREIFTCVHCMVSGENCSTESETVPFMQTSILLP